MDASPSIPDGPNGRRSARGGKRYRRDSNDRRLHDHPPASRRYVAGARSKSQVYDLRQHAINDLTDGDLIEQAAWRDGLAPEQFMAREVAHVQVTEARNRY